MNNDNDNKEAKKEKAYYCSSSSSSSSSHSLSLKVGKLYIIRGEKEDQSKGNLMNHKVRNFMGGPSFRLTRRKANNMGTTSEVKTPLVGEVVMYIGIAPCLCGCSYLFHDFLYKNHGLMTSRLKSNETDGWAYFLENILEEVL